MALNGLIQKGVPSDWATHMIGHELTALYQIDHARTLAIIAPNLYKVMFETKKQKLAQYGKRIFGLTGSDDEIATKAIDKTTEFFHIMGMKTKLSECTDNYNTTADFIANRFQERGWVGLGEKQNITIEKVRKIVEMSY
jgi:NADP-dependent alcohol dehydrogenase